MALKVLLSQKTNRHVVKKLGTSYTYESHFGSFTNARTDNTGLNNPIGIAVDTSNNVYICDSNNSRVVKLNSSLVYVSSINLSSISMGQPYNILFDSVTGDIYVVGVYRNIYLSMVRMNTSLVVSKANNDIYPVAKEKPFAICRGFGVDEFLISLGKKIVKVTETSSAIFTPVIAITNEIINAAHTETIVREKKFNLVNKPIVPASYTVYRTYTETPTQVTTTRFQTAHFPVLGTPDVNFIVYKNTVELDYDINLNDPNDYIIDQANGQITLQKSVVAGDIIKIRYRYQMIDSVDYTLNLANGCVVLTEGVMEDWNLNRDRLEFNYSYVTQAVEQTIVGISNATITGLLKHTNGDIYVAQNTLTDAGKISRVNSSYVNIGDTNKISKYIICVAKGLDGSLLTYDSSNQKIVRYSEVMNYVEDVYNDTADTVQLDCYDICDIIEANM